MIINNNLTAVITLLLISSSGTSFTQENKIDYNTLSQRYNITHEEDDILKLECKLTGKTIIKTENIKHIPSDYDFDLVIDLRTIDTTQYSDLFTFWSEIPPYSEGSLIIADVNEDGRKDV